MGSGVSAASATPEAGAAAPAAAAPAAVEPANSPASKTPLSSVGLLQQQAEAVLDHEVDGQLLGLWHLTFVNFIGLQQDRLVLLSERTIVRVHMNLVTGVVFHSTKFPLDDIESVTIGPLLLTSSKVGHTMAETIRFGARARTHANAVYLLSMPDGHERSQPALCRGLPRLSKRPHTVRIVMSDRFVARTAIGGNEGIGLLGKAVPRTKLDLKRFALISKLDSAALQPNEYEGPRSIHSLASRLIDLLDPLKIREAEVVIATDPVAVLWAPAPQAGAQKPAMPTLRAQATVGRV